MMADVLPISRNRASAAQRVIETAKRVTPRGCARPWGTKANLEMIERLLQDVPIEEIEQYLVDTARVVAESTLEQPRYWTLPNLFGERTMEGWRASVATFYAQQDEERQAAEAKERERQEAERTREAERQSYAAHVDPKIRALEYRYRSVVGEGLSGQLTLDLEGPANE